MNKLTEKYLSREDIKTINDYKKAINENNIVVTCMGLYNHGKSTLLNALIGDYKNKTFKTADVRETTKSKSVKHGDLTIVDTPGLHAEKNDDKQVMDTVKESDINIFVHNVNTGAFVASEVDFFHNVKKHWRNPEQFIERTIFILSRVDEVNHIDYITNTHQEMTKQINEIFGIKANIIAVSAKDYADGKLDNEQELIDEGNLDRLYTTITTLSKNLTKELQETKKVRLLNLYESLIKRLSVNLEEKKLELNKLKQAKNNLDNDMNDDIKKIEQTLAIKYKSIPEDQDIDILSANIEDLPYLLYAEKMKSKGEAISFKKLDKLKTKLKAKGQFKGLVKVAYQMVKDRHFGM